MKFSHIVPTAYLQKCDKYSSIYLILEHIAREDEEYRKFFKESTKYKILDNGAYEKGYPSRIEDLVGMAEELKADEIVVPDVFQDAYYTMVHFKEFVTYKKEHPEIKKFKFMGVPQGTTPEEYQGSLDMMMKSEDIDVIGLSFIVIRDAFGVITGFDDIKRNRIFLTSLLSLIPRYDKEFHLLGMGDCEELLRQKQFPWIRSGDSSTCFVHGLNDVMFDRDKGLMQDRITTKLNFDIDLVSMSSADAITHNLEVLNGLLQMY